MMVAVPHLCCLLAWPFLPQAQLLKELEYRVTQEALTRQQLDVIRTSSMEKLLEEVDHKEQQLQLLSEEAERASKLGQLQRRKMERDLRQVSSGESQPEHPARASSLSLPLHTSPLSSIAAAFATSRHTGEMVISIPHWDNCLNERRGPNCPTAQHLGTH